MPHQACGDLCGGSRVTRFPTATVTRVNAEQASKGIMRKPTRPDNGEGCHQSGSERHMHRQVPPGYWRQHAWKRGMDATREALSGGVARANRQPTRDRLGRQGGGEARMTEDAG